MKLIALNLYFYTFFLLYSALIIPILILVVTVCSLFQSRRATMKLFRRAISWYGKGATLISYPVIRVRYESAGGETDNEAFVIVCNHRAASDAFLMSVLPFELVQVVNIWPFRIPVLGFFARKAGYLNIRMMESDAFFEQGDRLIQEKVSIVFFPEGTRSAGKTMGNFHGAAFRLAVRSRAAILPICISGNENIPPKGSLLLRPGTIRIRRMPVISVQEYDDVNVFSLKNRVRDMIGQELERMEGRA